MRKLLFTAATILVATSASAFAAPISSQWLSAPYCATYGTEGQTTTCGFQSLQQCQAFVSGQSGSCSNNNPAWSESQARYVLPTIGQDGAAVRIDDDYNQRP